MTPVSEIPVLEAFILIRFQAPINCQVTPPGIEDLTRVPQDELVVGATSQVCPNAILDHVQMLQEPIFGFDQLGWEDPGGGMNSATTQAPFHGIFGGALVSTKVGHS